MWDERYAKPGYLFGTEPAAFLRAQAGRIAPGSRILCVADGEGRNSVWLAGQGHEVTAFDASPVALEKARKLARERGVEVAFHHSGVEDWDWSKRFDVVAAIFIQFLPPDARDAIFRDMKRALLPGGLLLLHGYAPRQVDYGTGGPPCRENMYTTDMLRESFADFEILRLADYDAEIREGTGHSGMSGLVDLVARKPSRDDW